MSPAKTPPKTKLNVTRTAWGATVTYNGLTIEARGAARGEDVRVAVTILRDAQLLYTDKVNLTSARSRTYFLAQAKQKGGPIPDKILLALGDVIRRHPRPPVETAGPDSDPTPTEAITTLGELKKKVGKYLLLKDPDALEVLLAAVAAHGLAGSDPVWLVIIAPPSGVKTELVRLLWGVPGIFPLSELTARTFASGLSPGGEDPSLLHRLTTEILVLKDFTTVLQMRHDERQAILAQLREIYDGSFKKHWGTGKELAWQGRLGFIAGVTPVIDKHHAVMAILGQRFVLLRLQPPDRQKVGRRAMRNTRADRQTLRNQLIPMVASFMRQLSPNEPTVSESHEITLAALSDFVTRARSAVQRDGYKQELDYAPEPEGPGRFVRELLSLLRGLAMVAGRPTVTDDDLRRVVRVALDSLPDVRRLVLRKLTEHGETVTTKDLAQEVQYATATLRRALEDLQALELVLCEKGKGGSGGGDRWQLKDDWRNPLRAWFAMLSVPRPDFSGTIDPEDADEAAQASDSEPETQPENAEPPEQPEPPPADPPSSDPEPETEPGNPEPPREGWEEFRRRRVARDEALRRKRQVEEFDRQVEEIDRIPGDGRTS